MMKNWQRYIDKLSWNDYRNLWSEFWVKKLGYDSNASGFAKVVHKLSIEEARKRDERLEAEFLIFVKPNK